MMATTQRNDTALLRRIGSGGAGLEPRSARLQVCVSKPIINGSFVVFFFLCKNDSTIKHCYFSDSY